jgi:hypothetical protein
VNGIEWIVDTLVDQLYLDRARTDQFTKIGNLPDRYKDCASRYKVYCFLILYRISLLLIILRLE